MCLQVLKSLPNKETHILKGWALTFIIICIAAVCFLCWSTTSKIKAFARTCNGSSSKLCPGFQLPLYGQSPYNKTFTGATQSKAVWKKIGNTSAVSSAIPALYANYFCRDTASQQTLFISSISASPGLHTEGCQERAPVKSFYLVHNSFHANGQLPRKSILYNLRKSNWNNLMGYKFASQMRPRS